jgi:hypothetical protein
VVDIVDEAVSGGLWADQTATPGSTLTSEDTLELVALCSVCAEEVSNLAATDADVAGWNVRVGTCGVLRK